MTAELVKLLRFQILDARNGAISGEPDAIRICGWAADEIERLQRASVDGHCRQCTCDDCSRFYREIDRSASTRTRDEG